MEIGPEWIIVIIAIIYLVMRKRTEGLGKKITDRVPASGKVAYKSKERSVGKVAAYQSNERSVDNFMKEVESRFGPELLSEGVQTMKFVINTTKDEIKREIKDEIQRELNSRRQPTPLG